MVGLNVIGSFGSELGFGCFGVKISGLVAPVVAGIYFTGQGRADFSIMFWR